MDKMLEWILEMCKKGHVVTHDDLERFFSGSTSDEAETENEAHILTREELDDWNDYVWLEFKRNTVMKVDLITYGIVLNVNDEEENVLVLLDRLNWNDYEKTWRYWSDKPTIEQRRTAWKDK